MIRGERERVGSALGERTRGEAPPGPGKTREEASRLLEFCLARGDLTSHLSAVEPGSSAESAEPHTPADAREMILERV